MTETRPSATGHAEPAQERLNLISSDRVRGTRVFGLRSEHIGEIDSFVIDKPSGRIVYAMMSFRGFLGFGEDIYPIPWSKLSYDTELAGSSRLRRQPYARLRSPHVAIRRERAQDARRRVVVVIRAGRKSRSRQNLRVVHSVAAGGQC